MKKLILFSVFAFAMVMTTSAQSFKFGVKAGANFSNLTVESDFGSISPDGATSLYIGALVDFGISEKFHIQPELLYSIEGADDADVTFINLPIMGKYYVVDGFNVQFGPQIGFLVDAEGGTDGLKGTNFGLNFGAGYELEGGFFFDARYNLGLSNIAEEEEGFEGAELKTKGFQIGIGYRF
ncbi:porin family protein [Flavobacteriaceae bacterium M23B6Z8]